MDPVSGGGGFGGGMPAVGGADGGMGGFSPAADAGGGNSGPGSMKDMFAKDSFQACGSGGG